MLMFIVQFFSCPLLLLVSTVKIKIKTVLSVFASKTSDDQTAYQKRQTQQLGFVPLRRN